MILKIKKALANLKPELFLGKFAFCEKIIIIKVYSNHQPIMHITL